MSDNLSAWERIYPTLPAALLTGGILAALVAWVGRRASDRRSMQATRHELIAEMMNDAFAFYMQLQVYWRFIGGSSAKRMDNGQGFEQPPDSDKLTAAGTR